MFRTVPVKKPMAGMERLRSVSLTFCQPVQQLSSGCNSQLYQGHHGYKQITNQNYWTPGSLNCILVTTRSVSTSKQCLASRFYNPKISITMKKNVERGTAQLLAAEERAKLKREKRLGRKSIIKNPLIDDTRKTKTFNWKFQENVGNVMAEMPELIGHGIAITRVSTRADFSEVLVFWVANPDKLEMVADLLDLHVRKIRRTLIDEAGMGQIPKVTFVKDIAYMLETELEGLFR